jgi:hypothetical protein
MSSSRRTFRRVITSALAGVALACAHAGAALAQFQEYQVKAAYLYKFAPFIDWPANAFASPTSPLVLCVAGEDPFGPVLDRAVAGQKLGARTLEVRRLGRADKAAGCHILYLSGSKAQTIGDGLASLRGAPVLTVTDEARNADERGMIHFVVRGRNVRFQIDEGAAQRNGLNISSKLLSLAVSVKARS